jgi:hypothetical protein
MKLTERIVRDDVEDKIYLGELVERGTKGEFGDLFRLLVNGVFDDQLGHSINRHDVPADRYLGRMEGLKMLQDKLILMIDIKNQLIEERKESNRNKGDEGD